MSSKKKIEKRPENKSNVVKFPDFKVIETVGNGLKLSSFLNYIVNKRIFSNEKAHYWATYILYQLKHALEAYHEANKSLPRYKEYQEAFSEAQNKATKDNLDKESIDSSIKDIEKKFKEYVEKRDSLQEEKLELKVRPFLTKWAFQCGPLTDVSGILIEFDLFDNPENILDILYADDE